jgi:hypothetical protein
MLTCIHFGQYSWYILPIIFLHQCIIDYLRSLIYTKNYYKFFYYTNFYKNLYTLMSVIYTTKYCNIKFLAIAIIIFVFLK